MTLKHHIPTLPNQDIMIQCDVNSKDIMIQCDVMSSKNYYLDTARNFNYDPKFEGPNA